MLGNEQENESKIIIIIFFANASQYNDWISRKKGSGENKFIILEDVFYN